MGSEDYDSPLKIVFLPFPEAGHMSTMSDLAKTICSHGVECNIITTPANSNYFKTSGNPNMIIHTLTFPGPDVGLPPGVENFSSATSRDMPKLGQALSMLRKPTQDLIRKLGPDCIISDGFFPWTSDFADEIRVPRVFPMASTFTHSCAFVVKHHSPHEKVENDEDLVSLPFLPHNIVMKKSQLPEWVRVPNEYTRIKDAVDESKLKSFGVLANTFPWDADEYQEVYSKLTGLKVWNVGPLCLQNTRFEEMDKSGSEEEEEEDGDDCWVACRNWLDQKEPKSVLYVSFGSMTRFPDDQLREIAAGLESSGHDFIWVVRKKKNNEEKDEEWSVEEFRKRMEESKKGFIIENWAPQVRILKHQSIGGMVTHCGCNTLLEGVTTAGVPLVTWPLFAEQFYNERLVVDVLKIGVPVGVSEWCNVHEIGTKEVVGREKVEAAVRAAMADGEVATVLRRRAMELKDVSKRAVQDDGGSSLENLKAFFAELKAKRILRLA